MSVQDLITEYENNLKIEKDKLELIGKSKLDIFKSFCKTWLMSAEDLITSAPFMVADKPAIELGYNGQRGFIRFDGKKFILSLNEKSIELRLEGVFPIPLTAREIVPLLEK